MENDIQLFEVILSKNPWDPDTGDWQIILNDLPYKENVTPRTIREHANITLDNFKREDKINQRRYIFSSIQ